MCNRKLLKNLTKKKKIHLSILNFISGGEERCDT